MIERRGECWIGDVLRACAALDGFVDAEGAPRLELIDQIAELVLPVKRPTRVAVIVSQGPWLISPDEVTRGSAASVPTSVRGTASTGDAPGDVAELPTQLVELARSEPSAHRARVNPRTWALVVGVSGDHDPALAGAVRDAKRFASALTANRPGVPIVAREDLTLLTDAAASRSALLRALYEAADSTQAFERFIFYFAGHVSGGPSREKIALHLIGEDHTREYFEFDTILDLLSTQGPRQQLYFIDAPRPETLLEPSLPQRFSKNGNPPTRAILFHPGGGRASLADHLLEALTGADAEYDAATHTGRVTMRSIAQLAQRRAAEGPERHAVPLYLEGGATLAPLWTFDDADRVRTALPLDETEYWQTAPPELLEPSLARAIGRELASVLLPSSRIDVEELVRRAAAGEQISRLPRLEASAVRFGVDLLVDVGAHVEMFAHDVRHLRALLRSLLGAELLRVLHFDRTPTRVGIGPRRRWAPYRPVDAPRRVLFVTRLDAAADEEWLPLLRDLRARGARPLALVPHGVERVSTALRAQLPLVEWDRGATVSTVRRANRA